MKQIYTLTLALSVLIATTSAASPQRGRAENRFGHPEPMAVKGVLAPIKQQPTEKTAKKATTAWNAASYNTDGSLEIPFTLAPTQEDIDRMTIIDVEKDGRTWSYEATEEALFYRYSTKLDADDYAIIPINITETDRLFRFSVSARCQNGYFGEAFEMCAGPNPTPEALKPIFSSGMIYNEEYKTFEAFFAAPETGTYYVALHIVSPKNCMRFYVQDISVEQTELNRLVPAECNNINATAAPLGALSATVVFNAPALHADGSTIEPSSQLSIKVASAIDAKTITAAPGQQYTVDIATEQGNNTIELIPSNDNGEGLHATCSLFTGPDIPANPNVTATVSADNMTMTLHMSVSDIGKNGGYVNPSAVEYHLHSYVEEGYYGSWELLKDLGTVTEYDYTLPVGTTQSVVNLGITAHNAQGDNPSVVSVSEVIGTPYPIPATETFAGKKFNYFPVVPEAPTDEFAAEYTTLDPTDLFEDATNNSKIAMVGYITDYGETKGQLALPRFSTKNVTSATIGIRVYFHELMPETTLALYGFETNPITVGTIDASMYETGWHTVSFDIPEDLLGRDWVCPTITSAFPGEDEDEYIIIDKYFLRPVLAHNVAVESMYGNNKLTVAEESTFLATVENCGTEPTSIENAKFLLEANGVTVSSQTVKKLTLEPEETTDISFTFTPTADHIGNLTLTLRIDDNDDYMNDNSYDLSFTVEKGEEPIVTDLKGNLSETSDGIDLAWSPIGKLAGFQNMEKLSAFYYGKKLGEFTNYDGDGKNTFIISGFSFPGNGYAKAFQVFNYPKSNINAEAYLPFSGDQYLIAFAPDDEITAADDYLISPAIASGSEVSFMFNIITGKFGAETIELMASSTDDSPASFSPVRSFTKETQGWEKITETLPADANYFALHYTSCNTFGIMIDDIDYIPQEGLPVVTYNIYRNGSVIATDITDAAYNDKEAPVGTNSYNVSVVVDGEEKPLSNTAIVAMSGISGAKTPLCSVYGGAGKIIFRNISGETVAIYRTDGRLVDSFNGIFGTASVEAQHGIYIIRCGTTTFKISVTKR